MNGQAEMLRAGWMSWWVRRNPMYLMSAACMAVGTRLYLVSPSTRAGDLGLILLTLGILQAYEWAVGAVLIALNRWNRAPEDQPSLLLVIVLFWTGPMAATAEMTAHRPVLGLICAAGACLIALAELQIVHRALGWRFSWSGRIAASACVVFLAAAPPLLRIPESASGTNEVFLYASWWVLAAIGLMGIAVVRHHTQPRGASKGREFHLELAMLALVVGATAAHLSGMNYAYFSNAQWFYASPLIIVVSVVMMEYLAQMRRTRLNIVQCAALCLASVLPVLAIVWAHGHFDERMPLGMLPRFLQDPLLTTLAAAALAWWFGFLRFGHPILLHGGSAATAWACLRAVRLYAPGAASIPLPSSGPFDPEAARNLIVIGLYLVAAYLIGMALVRRSRSEAVAALIVHQIAWTLMLVDRTPADMLLVCISAGWAWLVCLHLLGRPSLTANVLPLAFLLLVTWASDWDPGLCWHARSHAAAMMLVLVLAALVRPASRYGLLTICAALAHAIFYGGRWLGETENAIAAFVVVAAFVLLASGAAISWRKQSLLLVGDGGHDGSLDAGPEEE